MKNWLSLNIRYLEFKFCTLKELNIVYIYIFQIFSKLQDTIFSLFFLQKERATCRLMLLG
jgi:hypothetical protein